MNSATRSQRRRRVGVAASVMLWSLAVLVTSPEISAAASGTTRSNTDDDNDGGEKDVPLREVPLGNDKPVSSRWAQARQRRQQERDQREQARQQRRAERAQRRQEFQEQFQWTTSDTNDNDGDHQEYYFANTTAVIQGIFGWFPTPRHLWQGVQHSVKTLLAVTVYNIGAVLVLPYMGYASNGIGAMIIGVVVGGVATVPALLLSAAIVVHQLALGLLHTPRALWALWTGGQLWDVQAGRYVYYNLTLESEKLGKARTNVRDHEYYETLGVDPGATPKEIKKAYYTKAKHVHPDKRDDPDSNDAFLRLHKAYSVLSDEKLRADYDRYGTKQQSGRDSTDATGPAISFGVFYTILLDMETVEPLVGELSIVTYSHLIARIVQLSKAEQSDAVNILYDIVHSLSAEESRRRFVDVATHLRAFLESKDLDRQFRDLASNIADSTLGDRYLQVLGNAFLQQANTQLGYSSPIRVPLGLYNSARQAMSSLHAKFQRWHKAYEVVVDLVATSNNATNATVLPNATVDKPLTTGDNSTNSSSSTRLTADMFYAKLDDIFDVAWNFIALDMQHAVHEACRRLFADGGNIANANQRARAVRRLGQVFLQMHDERCVSTETTQVVIRERLDLAYRMAVKAAQQ